MDDQEEIPPHICPGCYCPKDERAELCRRCWRFGKSWWMNLTPEAYETKMAEIYGEAPTDRQIVGQAP